jgi:hypothetical protein
VDVTVQPADQVYDLAEMAGGTGTFPSGFPTSIAPPPAD